MKTLAFRTFSFAGLLGVFPALLVADTVYLKNGAWIDGIVRTRSAEVIQVDIGNIGRMEIPLEEVYEIEKNSRTGSSMFLSVEGREVDVAIDPEGEDADVEEEGGDDESEGDDEEGDQEGEGEDEKGGEAYEIEAEPIDPELKERIEKLVYDLQRQKSRYRVRAERHLKAVGPPAIPFLVPLADHEGELVRIAVFRLFHSFGDDRVIDSCIEGLVDTNEYVRDYAYRALQRITKEDFGYKPFSSPRRRDTAKRKWARWWEEEKAILQELQAESR